MHMSPFTTSLFCNFILYQTICKDIQIFPKRVQVILIILFILFLSKQCYISYSDFVAVGVILKYAVENWFQQLQLDFNQN